MKKILSFMLTIILAFCMTITTFAAAEKTETIEFESNTTTKSTSSNVDVIIAGQDDIVPVYNVVVEWESLDFTYNFSKNDTWNPETHDYVAGAGGGWADSDSTITVTNHSNAQIRARASFADNSDKLTRNDVTATLSNPSFTVASAVGTSYDAAPNGTFTCSVSGVPSITTNFTIGTITITIEAVTTTE